MWLIVIMVSSPDGGTLPLPLRTVVLHNSYTISTKEERRQSRMRIAYW